MMNVVRLHYIHTTHIHNIQTTLFNSRKVSVDGMCELNWIPIQSRHTQDTRTDQISSKVVVIQISMIYLNSNTFVNTIIYVQQQLYKQI